MDDSNAREAELTASGAYRSLLDIARILEGLSRERITIHADLGEDEGRRFASTILWVEPDISHFVVAYVADDEINSLLYKQAAIKFNADYHGDRITFFTRTPVDAMHKGKPAILFPMPESMHRYRRKHERITVPAEAGLRCVISSGQVAKFEMRVLDISEGGIGCIMHSENGPFAAGETIKNCRLIEGDGTEWWVDLSMQYSLPTLMPNGTYAQRLGLRFVEPPEEVKALARKFAA